MFIRYEEYRDNDHWIIVDDEFETALNLKPNEGWWLGFIRLYEDKKLPVIPNVMKCLQYTANKFDTTIKSLLNIHRYHFVKYQDEIDKYLLLL